MIMYASVLVLLIGLVMYYICTRAEHKEVGRIMFFCGLFVTLFRTSEKLIDLLK